MHLHMSMPLEDGDEFTTLDQHKPREAKSMLLYLQADRAGSLQ